jgi:hypothetical protein
MTQCSLVYRYISPRTDQITADLIKGWGRTLCCKTHILFGTQRTASATTNNTYVVINGFYIISSWSGNVWNQVPHQLITRCSKQNKKYNFLLPQISSATYLVTITVTAIIVTYNICGEIIKYRFYIYVNTVGRDLNLCIMPCL